MQDGTSKTARVYGAVKHRAPSASGGRGEYTKRGRASESENAGPEDKPRRKDGGRFSDKGKGFFRKEKDRDARGFRQEQKHKGNGHGRDHDRDRDRPEAGFSTAEQHEARVRQAGFSAFQLRLVNSILTSAIADHKPLDKAYALWFAKVKIPPVEQGFLIRQINAMFRRLSYYAFVAGLKRPSDFERHVGRLVFSYCAERGWPLPELEGEEGFDRHGLKKRLQEGLNNPLFRDGCPVWLEDQGQKELGDRWPEEREALGAESKRFIRVNPLKCDRDTLAQKLSQEGVVTRSVKDYPYALEVTSNAALFRTQAFKDGLFEQQDIGSQAIVTFLNPKAGTRVIDACAGSGGKTLLIAALMENKGSVIALDTEQWKLEDLKKRARRAGAFNIEPRVIDSSKVIKRLHEHADQVIIDAPCSGSGVLRRNPDGKWRDGRDKLKELTAVQYELLERYSRMAKVGGEVVYSTCSVFKSENEAQIEKFLQEYGDKYDLVEQRQLLPSGGTDGFFMAKLKRKA